MTDEAGEPLLSTHACKRNSRYRYYVSKALQERRTRAGVRVPARELEIAVATCLAAALDDPLALASQEGLVVSPAALASLPERAGATAAQLRAHEPTTLRAMIATVQVRAGDLVIACHGAQLAELLGLERDGEAPDRITLTCPVRLARTGRAVKLVQTDGTALTGTDDATLVRLIVRARRWWAVLKQGEIDIGKLAADEGVQPSYVTRVLRLAFLSPQVTQAILAGKTPAALDGKALTQTGAVPPCWREQARTMLAAAA